jgi:pimeloyl-ACP methyl ester carboxylesterase
MFNAGSDPALRDRISHAMSLADPAAALAIRAGSSDYDPDAAMRAIARIPFALITSTRRPTFPEQIRDAHPGASIRIMPGIGHFIMNERPGEFEVLVREQLLLFSGAVKEG